jgi:hypothetical protein
MIHDTILHFIYHARYYLVLCVSKVVQYVLISSFASHPSVLNTQFSWVTGTVRAQLLSAEVVEHCRLLLRVVE